MTIGEKAKAYDKALEIAKAWCKLGNKDLSNDDLETLFPELKESEDERIRKAIIEFFELQDDNTTYSFVPKKDILSWLEKQGKKTNWKPSKEEMDVLYGLAYITDQYDERKEEVITRLYQDLKREFFNNSNYENMFPTNTSTEDDVRRRSTIQVLEYARSLDTYNQYGKADIDKNIAWLENQNKNNMCILEATKQKLEDSLNNALEKETPESLNEFLNEQGESANKVVSKFHKGDWIVYNNSGDVCQVTEIRDNEYSLWPLDAEIMGYLRIIDVDDDYHLWSIKDAKDGDILVYNDSIFIFNEIYKNHLIYYGIYEHNKFYNDKYYSVLDLDTIDINNIHPATKEQQELLFHKMEEAKYKWDNTKKELKKIKL